MAITKKFNATFSRIGYTGALLPALFLAAATLATPADDNKIETIDATAMGTSTQLGKTVSVKIIIQKYSTQEDREALVAAYKAGQNKGLVDALEKSPSIGNIAITGTLGQQLAYISVTKTDTGRRIRFATNRLIKFGEAYHNTQSMAFDLTAGEININDSDNKKSGGVLYPASQLIVNKDGQLEFQLRRNPWKLVNIIDWNKAGATK